MGREILYCCHCSTRLSANDFDQGTAYKVDNKACCAACVEEVVAEMPAEKQEAILYQHQAPKPAPKKDTGTRTRGSTGKVPTAQNPRSTGRVTTARTTPSQGTRSIPKRGTQSIPKAPPPEEGEGDEAPPANPKKKILIVSLAAGGGLVLVIVLLVLLLSGKKKADLPGTAEGSKPPPAVVLTPEQAAKAAYLTAELFQKQNPRDYGGQWAKIRDAEKAVQGSAWATALEGLALEMRKRISRDTLEIIEQSQQGAFGREEFKTLLGDLEKARDRHDVPDWQEPLAARIKEVQTRINERFENVRKLAVEAKSRGDDPGVETQTARLEKWGLPDYITQLKAALDATPVGKPDPAATPANPALPAATPAPAAEEKPASPAVKAYRERWQRALFHAYLHDFAAALGELEKIQKETEDADAKAEAQVDLELLRRASELYQEGMKKVAALPQTSKVELEYADFPSQYKKVAGTVIKRDAHRLEIRTEGEKSERVFVELKAISSGALALQVRWTRGDRPEEAEGRALAALAILEGDTDSARVILKGADHRLPSRYWLHGAEVREKAPKPERREFEARKLFYAAELDWRTVKTWGPAIERYKTLQNDYPLTEIVKQNLDLILKRGSVGKEYVKGAAEMRMSGEFRRAKPPAVPKATVPEIVAVQAGKDVDESRTLQNFAEVEFYALPGTPYRCWAYVSACCAETFGFYLQTTEGMLGKDAIDPTGTLVAPLESRLSGLKKTHAQHVKDPKVLPRWDWIPIPLPKEYSTPGAKTVRLLSTQTGFSVGYFVISSLRKATPNDAETKEFAKEAAALGPARSEIKGTPDPSDWLLLGPLDNRGIAVAQPPETDAALDKEFQGKTGKVKYKEAKAELQAAGGAKAGVLDFLKVFDPKENVSCYAVIHVRAPQAMDARILAGSDDQLKVWVNGKAVHTLDKGRGVKVDEDTIPCRLEEGWNRLLFKVCTGGGGFGLAARVTDANKRPIDGLEYHPYGDPND